MEPPVEAEREGEEGKIKINTLKLLSNPTKKHISNGYSLKNLDP